MVPRAVTRATRPRLTIGEISWDLFQYGRRRDTIQLPPVPIHQDVVRIAELFQNEGHCGSSGALTIVAEVVECSLRE